jgi:hypothetical protein
MSSFDFVERSNERNEGTNPFIPAYNELVMNGVQNSIEKTLWKDGFGF